MVSGPPCPQCGMPLRWFAEQNAWGCDRCRQMFPAQPQPQQQVQPQMQQMPQQGAPPRKSGSGMKLAIGAVVLIGAIVTIAVVASGKKNDNELDRFWLMELRNTNDAVCACQDDDCVRKAMAALDKTHTEIAEKMTLSSAEEKEQHELLAKIGECVKNVPGTEAPPGQAAAGDAMLRDLRQLRDRACACKDVTCTASVADDSQKWAAKYKPVFDTLPGSVRGASKEIIEAETKCVEAVLHGAPTAPTHAAPSADQPSDDPPQECAEWKRALDRVEACDAIPADNAKMLKTAYLQMAASWRQLPRAQLVETCKTSADSLTEAVDAACPE
jgi:hypothetical protein